MRYMIIGLDEDGVRNGYVTFDNSTSTMIFIEKERAEKWIINNRQEGITFKVVEDHPKYREPQF